MLVEDAHWIDPTSLELLDLVVERIKKLSVLLVVTSRPEFQLAWSRHTHVAALALDRLDPHQSAALIARAAAGRALPKPLLDLLVAKADGVPLFLEELLKTVLESGQLEDMGDRWRLAGALPTLTIPATLQDSLLARIERMAPVREVAQVAAAIGRQFSRELISRVTQLEDRTLDLALARLSAGELIHPIGTPSGDGYSFKHALVQDAAYSTLLRSKRALIHGRIASELLLRDAEDPPEIVAHHLTEAGEVERSVAFWELAGQLAVSRAASREAVAHFQRAISQLLSLPETIERKRREAYLQDALGGALAHIAGLESDALAQVHERVRDLSRQTGDVKRQFIAEWNLWHVYVARWEHRRADCVGSLLMEMAESAGDPELLLQALHIEWSTLGALGELAATRNSCERGWALYDPKRHGRHHLVFGAHDPGVCSRVICSFETWCLGRPDEALACYEAGLALARRLDHPLVLLHALAKGLPLFQLLRDHERLGAQVDATLTLAAEQDSTNFGIEAQLLRAWILGEKGAPDHAARLMQESIREFCSRGATGVSPYYMSLLAEAQAKANALDDALVTVESAQERGRLAGNRWCEPELHRIRGEIMCGKGCENEAERSLKAALSRAHAIEARGWELRVATSLARLWSRQGRRAEAKQLLCPIHGGFTQGHHLPDLRDAQALLAELP